MYGFSDIINVLGSAPGTAFHLHSSVINTCRSKLKWYGGFSKCIFISHLLLLTYQLDLGSNFVSVKHYFQMQQNFLLAPKNNIIKFFRIHVHLFEFKYCYLKECHHSDLGLKMMGNDGIMGELLGLQNYRTAVLENVTLMMNSSSAIVISE